MEKLLKKIAERLSQEKIEYMIIGGQAVLVYGEPRLTKDIDITLGVDIDELDRILKIVEELQLRVLPQDVRTFVEKTMVLPAEHIESGLRVDFIFSNSPYEREALKRVKKIMIDDVSVNYVSLEDLIIHKIVSGRPRDLEDVSVVLLRNRDLDEEYLRRWLKIFSEILEEDLIKKYEDLKKSSNFSSDF